VRKKGGVRVAVATDGQRTSHELVLPQKIVNAWRYGQELQTQMDAAQNAVKEQLSRLSIPRDLSDEARALAKRVATLHLPGLFRLWHLVRGTTTHHEELLMRWVQRMTFLRRQKRGLETCFRLHRNERYKLWARNLCARYAHIIVEHINLKALAEKDNDSTHLDDAAKYRQLAAPSILLGIIKQTASTFQRSHEDKNPAFTSQKCPTCGVRTKSAEELITCTNGHTYDRDEGAGFNLIHAPRRKARVHVEEFIGA
jgi:hypothetical protein